MREKEIYEKQRECDKQYIRRSKKPELKKQRYFSESEIESESEAYCNFGYDESDRKENRKIDVTYSRKKTMPKQNKRNKRMKAKARMTTER